MTTITHAEISPVTAGSRSFLLERVQPALSGLMDGSLSTLAPIFAVVLATHHPLTAFYTGAATALGAGVSRPVRGAQAERRAGRAAAAAAQC
jgi:hypothetical protein